MVTIIENDDRIEQPNDTKCQAHRKQSIVTKTIFQSCPQGNPCQVSDTKESIGHSESCSSVFVWSDVHYEALGGKSED